MGSAEFWSNAALEYNKKTIYDFDNEKTNRAWREVLVDILGQKENMRVLDAGSGTGFLSMLLATMGHSVIGVERASNMLKIAAENAASRGLHVDFVSGDVYNFQMIEQSSLDALLSRYLVWTLESPEKAFREWLRVLKPGGRLIIIDANWYRNLSRSRLLKIWRKMAWLLDFVTEGKKPWGRGAGDADFYNLPFSRVERPEEDSRLLELCGYRVLEIKPDIRPQINNLLDYLKTGYWGPIFVIIAEKPCEEEKIHSA